MKDINIFKEKPSIFCGNKINACNSQLAKSILSPSFTFV